MAFLVERLCRAFFGLDSLDPVGCHSQDDCFLSTSYTETQLSSPVTNFIKYSSSSLRASRLSWHSLMRNLFCSSVKILGMNFGASFESFMSFLRTVCTEDLDMGKVSAIETITQYWTTPLFLTTFNQVKKILLFIWFQNYFQTFLFQCLNFILTQVAKLWGNLSLTQIGGPPKQTTQADHFSQITQYQTTTGPQPDHLQPETSTETWFESGKYFLFLLKKKHFVKKNLISGGPLAWCWNTVGLEKWSFFPLFHFPKKWKFTIFLMKIFYEYIIQKIWNFVKLHFVLLFQKKICSLDAQSICIQLSGGQGDSVFLGWKWLFSSKWTTLKTTYFWQMWIKLHLASTS